MADDRSRMLSDIAETADALTDSYVHVEPIYTADKSRNKKLTHVHRVTMPGLLAQVHELYEPGSRRADSSSSTPSSRPPLNVEAASLHLQVTLAVTRWCWSLGLELRDTVESNVRALVGAATSMDSDTQDALLSEMRSWRRRAAMLTGWQTAPWRPRAHCPACGAVGTLVVNLAAREAYCTSWNPQEQIQCVGWWDEGTILQLADHVKAETDGREAA